VYASQGSWSEASEAFGAALAENPDHVTALVGSSNAWLKLDRPDLARQSLEHARTLTPRDARIAEMLRRAIAAERASSR
jgi:predicted Zn-dependent protease